MEYKQMCGIVSANEFNVGACVPNELCKHLDW